MTYRLQVVSSGLLNALVRVDRGVAGSTSQVLSIFVGNMLIITVHINFSKAEVNDVNGVFILFRATDQEIVRLDIAVNDALLVHLLDAFDHLDSDQQHCLEVE